MHGQVSQRSHDCWKGLTSIIGPTTVLAPLPLTFPLRRRKVVLPIRTASESDDAVFTLTTSFWPAASGTSTHH
jgi:hypothetical protein